jgi:hypothetical protein
MNDATTDASAEGAAALGDESSELDAGDIFDVTIQYADRPLPDVQVPPEVGPAVDAAPDVAPTGPSPCVSVPCASSGPNSVLCTGNDGGMCTVTEAMIVARDISRGKVISDAGAPDGGDGGDAVGQLTADSCYECALQNDCMDDDIFSDTCRECGDLAGPNGTACSKLAPPALDGEPPVQACLDALACILSTHCGSADPPEPCFCGTATGAACLVAGAANGACLQQEIDGLLVGSCESAYPAPLMCTEGDPTATIKAFTQSLTPAGMANALIGCAVAKTCASQCAP